MAISKYKNKNGVFYKAEVWISSCKIASKRGFTRKRDAVKWHDETRDDFKAGRVKQDQTIEVLIEKFKQVHYPMISESTRTRYDSHLKLRILPYFRFRQLKAIKKFHINEFRSSIAVGLVPNGVNQCLSILNQMFNLAIECNWLTSSPVVGVKKMKLSNSGYNWFSEKEQISAYLEAAKQERYYLIFKLALETGMRRGEIIGLGRDDICFKTGRISIWKQFSGALCKLQETKTRSARYVSFPKGGDLEHELKLALETFDHQMPIVYKNKPVRLLFHTPDQLPVQPGWIGSNVHKRICERAGVPHIRFHDLRHTFASWYMMTQDNLWELRKILGHCDITMTMRYSHLSKRTTPVPSDMYGILNSEKLTPNSPQQTPLHVVKS